MTKQISLTERPNVIPKFDTPHTLSQNDPRHVFVKTVTPERKNSVPKSKISDTREEVPTLLAHVKVSERASNFKKATLDVDRLSFKGTLGNLSLILPSSFIPPQNNFFFDLLFILFYSFSSLHFLISIVMYSLLLLNEHHFLTSVNVFLFDIILLSLS